MINLTRRCEGSVVRIVTWFVRVCGWRVGSSWHIASMGRRIAFSPLDIDDTKLGEIPRNIINHGCLASCLVRGAVQV